MQKKKLSFLIPFLIVGIFISCSWIIFLTSDTAATWRHYVALFLFTPLLILSIKELNFAIVYLGIFLIFGIVNILSITPSASTIHLKFFFDLPGFNLLCLGIFVLYLSLNLNSLIDIRLDQLERRKNKASGAGNKNF